MDSIRKKSKNNKYTNFPSALGSLDLKPVILSQGYINIGVMRKYDLRKTKNKNVIYLNNFWFYEYKCLE